MYIGVACADDYAVVAVEPQIAVETITPGTHRDEKPEQGRAVSNRCRRHRSVVNIVFDVAVHPVDHSGGKRAQNERQQHPVLAETIAREYEEIEADVLVVERVVCTIGYVIEKLQVEDPIAGFSSGRKQSEITCTA